MAFDIVAGAAFIVILGVLMHGMWLVENDRYEAKKARKERRDRDNGKN